jgi:hypothetical protein
MNVLRRWTVEDREHLAVVTLGAFELPDRGELVGRITENYVPARHLEGAVDALYAAHDFIGRVTGWKGDTREERDELLAEIEKHLPDAGGQ